MVKTYNVGAFGIPASLVKEVDFLALSLRYTRHAMSEACHDRYGALPATALPRAFYLNEGWDLVEAETIAGRLSKFIVRRPVDGTRSLVLVILREGLVKTLWTNLNTDKHATLDKSKFSTP